MSFESGNKGTNIATACCIYTENYTTCTKVTQAIWSIIRISCGISFASGRTRRDGMRRFDGVGLDGNDLSQGGYLTVLHTSIFNDAIDANVRY